SGLHVRASTGADVERGRTFCSVVRTYIERTEHARRSILPSIPHRFRNNPTAAPAMKFAVGKNEYQVGGEKPTIEIISVGEDYVDALIEGVRCRFHIRQHGAEYYVRSTLGQRQVTRMPKFPETNAS